MTSYMPFLVTFLPNLRFSLLAFQPFALVPNADDDLHLDRDVQRQLVGADGRARVLAPVAV